MRLTKQTNYSIRILMYCASDPKPLSRIAEVARTYAVSELFLFKILKPLVDAGLVETVRGRNGGVRLGRPADRITLFEVIRTTEESFALAECFENDDIGCPLVDHCRLNGVLHEALNAFMNVLAGYTIADLVTNRASMTTLLGLPPAYRDLGAAGPQSS